MAYETKASLNADVTVVLGGKDKKTGKTNPTSIEGYFLGNRITPDKGLGEGVLHIFQTENGNVGVWGKTSSKALLTDNHVGQMCLLSFTGMSTPKPGRQAAYQYKLQFDKGNTIDTSGLDVNASDESEPDFGNVDETDIDDSGNEEVYEAPVQRAAAPKSPARPNNAEQRAKINALISAGKSAKTA